MIYVGLAVLAIGAMVVVFFIYRYLTRSKSHKCPPGQEKCGIACCNKGTCNTRTKKCCATGTLFCGTECCDPDRCTAGNRFCCADGMKPCGSMCYSDPLICCENQACTKEECLGGQCCSKELQNPITGQCCKSGEIYFPELKGCAVPCGNSFCTGGDACVRFEGISQAMCNSLRSSMNGFEGLYVRPTRPSG